MPPVLYLCCSSSTWSISSLAHGQSDQPAQCLVPSILKTFGVYWNRSNDSRQAKPFSISSPDNSHARVRDKGKGWETQQILAAGSSVPSALSTALQPHKQMPAGQSVTYFPSLAWGAVPLWNCHWISASGRWQEGAQAATRCVTNTDTVATALASMSSTGEPPPCQAPAAEEAEVQLSRAATHTPSQNLCFSLFPLRNCLEDYP